MQGVQWLEYWQMSFWILMLCLCSIPCQLQELWYVFEFLGIVSFDTSASRDTCKIVEEISGYIWNWDFLTSTNKISYLPKFELGSEIFGICSFSALVGLELDFSGPRTSSPTRCRSTILEMRCRWKGNLKKEKHKKEKRERDTACYDPVELVAKMSTVEVMDVLNVVPWFCLN